MNKLAKLLIFVYKKIDRHLTILKHIDRIFDINGIKLLVNILDDGGTAYLQQSAEVTNPLYALIAKELNPEYVFDIGANYGFISAIMRKYMPDACIIAIEPNKRLFSYLLRNINSNGKIYNIICGDRFVCDYDFFINPFSSQDCRVNGMKGWKRQPVDMMSLDTIWGDNNKSVFLKVDVQGYEEKVILGGKKFFTENKWLMKMEFAPEWLKWHGTSPVTFLSYLCLLYDVAELPAIIPYHTKCIDDLFLNKITNNYEKFIEFVTNKKSGHAGWVELLIRPKDVERR